MFWYRTHDHPGANNRTPEVGEHQWNLDFTTEDGRQFRVHVGPDSRKAMIQMLADDKVKVVTKELLDQAIHLPRS